MKIMLVGEFSGLHKNLKEGLEGLGYQVELLSDGDGWKGVDGGLKLSPFKGRIGKIFNLFYNFFRFINIKNYDVVQFINPNVISKYLPRNFIINTIVKNNKSTHLVAAGGDSYFWLYGPSKLKYGPFEGTYKFDPIKYIEELKGKKALDYNNYFIKKVNSVIPIMHEYEASYEGVKKLTDCIALPMNIDKIKAKKNIVDKKIVFFHGLNRYGFKGTDIVEQAFEYLQKKYPNDIEIIIDGKMPLDRYLEVMKKTNVVIDQIHSHSLGMNGVYALALGKVVIGGAEPESLSSLKISTSPVINVKPTKESLIEVVEEVIKNKNEIKKISEESRLFVEKVHGYKEVALKYIEHWSGFLK